MLARIVWTRRSLDVRFWDEDVGKSSIDYVVRVLNLCIWKRFDSGVSITFVAIGYRQQQDADTIDSVTS